MRLLLLGMAAWGALHAQPRFPVQEIDEIGHMNRHFDDRRVADLGLAKAYSENEGEVLRIAGADATHKPWTAYMKSVGGVGWTRVFTADFDANGRQDLLFVQYFPGNGRCIDEVAAKVLLFDEGGRPVPWEIETHGLDDFDPLTLLDEDGDGQAEIVTSDCSYSEPPRFGEDRRLTGIYEADHAHWRPVRPISASPYVARFQIERQQAGDFVVWEAPEDALHDPHARRDEPEGSLDGLVYRANGEALFRVGNGKPVRSASSVVIDSAAGREVYWHNVEAAYQRLLVRNASIRSLGSIPRRRGAARRALGDGRGRGGAHAVEGASTLFRRHEDNASPETTERLFPIRRIADGAVLQP